MSRTPKDDLGELRALVTTLEKLIAEASRVTAELRTALASAEEHAERNIAAAPSSARTSSTDRGVSVERSNSAVDASRAVLSTRTPASTPWSRKRAKASAPVRPAAFDAVASTASGSARAPLALASASTTAPKHQQLSRSAESDPAPATAAVPEESVPEKASPPPRPADPLPGSPVVGAVGVPDEARRVPRPVAAVGTRTRSSDVDDRASRPDVPQPVDRPSRTQSAPVDPDHPAERIDYMPATADPVVVLSATAAEVSGPPREITRPAPVSREPGDVPLTLVAGGERPPGSPVSARVGASADSPPIVPSLASSPRPHEFRPGLPVFGDPEVSSDGSGTGSPAEPAPAELSTRPVAAAPLQLVGDPGWSDVPPGSATGPDPDQAPAAPAVLRATGGDEDSAAIRLAADMARGHGLKIRGFENGYLDADIVHEIAAALDDLLAKYPVPLYGIEVAEQREDTIRRERKKAAEPGPGGRPRVWITLERTELASSSAPGPGQTRRLFRRSDTGGRPVHAAVVRAFAAALDEAGGYRARQEAWRIMMADSLSGGPSIGQGLLDPRRALIEGFVEVELRGKRAGESAKTLHEALLKMAQAKPEETSA
ncbi:hypothetical protein [Nocardia sp. NBC_00416]|uniref:hypothetical protein n=1 Tax=Nocardia sp. NBC_00416 TaxID=2975991 RepID=UPI002E22AA04